MSQAENFFKELDRTFPAHPMKERYLQELQDHWEDLQEEEKLDSTHLTQHLMSKKLGSSQEIKENFFNILVPFRHLLFAAEALFWGSLMVPFSIFALMTFVDALESNSNMGLALLVMALLACAWPMAFHFLKQRGPDINATTGYSEKAWNRALFLPSGVAFLIMTFIHRIYLLDLISHDRSAFLMVPVWGVLLAVGFFGLWKIYEGFNAQFRKIKVDLKGFGVLLFAYAISEAIRVTAGANSLITEILEGLGTIFSLSTLSKAFISNATGFIPGAFFTAQLIAAFMAFLILQGLLSMIIFKRWSWLQGSIVLYCASLFFANPYVDVAMMSPAYPVSEVLERQELGPIFNITRYWNRDDAMLFEYSVDWEKDHFVVNQNTGIELTLDPQKIRNGEFDFNLRRANENFYENRESEVTLPEGVKCLFEGIEREKSPYYMCNQLTYGEDSFAGLFADKSPSSAPGEFIEDAAVSADGRWLMIVLSSNLDEADQVYLLDLQS